MFGACIHHREAPRAVAGGAAVVFYHLALRYRRIFPEFFVIVPLGGTVEDPDPLALIDFLFLNAARSDPLPGNPVGRTHIGLASDGGAWGARLVSFLFSAPAMDIYRHHGLLPAREEE